MAAIQQNGQMRRRKFDHCNGNLGKHDVLPGLDQKIRINHMINHVLAPVDFILEWYSRFSESDSGFAGSSLEIGSAFVFAVKSRVRNC